MRYVDEYRDPAAAKALVREIRAASTRRWPVMEICGGQTHTLLRAGIDQLVGDAVELVHGPGCPVCVTPLEKIDRVLAIAARPGTVVATFGDMMRVPGSSADLLGVKARGADVRIVYSPLDAVRLAAALPDRQVVFFGIGFETTAPANAMAVKQAALQGLSNFSVVVSHVRVPPAIEALLADPDCRVKGLLAPGHVCSVMGTGEYEALAEQHRMPFVVTGFEPLDLLQGLLMVVRLLEQGSVAVPIQYARSVRPEGNPIARAVLREVFEVADMTWRGLGVIPQSGLQLAPAFAAFDAERRFDVGDTVVVEPAQCLAGEVLRGLTKPNACPAFGTLCTPEHPLGAPMVSSEGACAAYRASGRVQAL